MAATPACAEIIASTGDTVPVVTSTPPDSQGAATSLEQIPVTLPVAPSETLVGVQPIAWNLGDALDGNAPQASAEVAAMAASGGEPANVGIGAAGFGGGGLDVSGDTVNGPADPLKRRWSDHIPRDQSQYRTFWQQARTVRTEALIGVAYFTLISSHKFFEETAPFHFKDEGYFGKDTENIGVDKLTHAFDTYLLAEFFHSQIHRKTGATAGDAITAAIIASGLMAFNEISDAIEPDSGYSLQDVSMNIAGAALSVLRNTVPGMKEKFSFKIEIVPNSNIYSIQGKPHYAQQRFMFSLKGAGFEELNHSPLRYLDLQVGYFASDFSNADKAAGVDPKRHLFFGVGLNLGELLFGKSQSRLGRVAYTVLDYFQLPYTSLRYDTTGRVGY
ncbi:DUF2279 domain-containing protein [Novosphingobium sp. PhB165]|uniref:DUF2279 domain-containing protein n=1 Tax=Novosphingobium sp. PhB165 TaxID=2485105 RepID=UPI001FB2691A|nr:DUF2279 domain-containing protein [Novosphingobium sp. PhB165]